MIKNDIKITKMKLKTFYKKTTKNNLAILRI